jgi:hypothetical protein
VNYIEQALKAVEGVKETPPGVHEINEERLTTWQIGFEAACNLAAKRTRESIVAEVERLEARAAEPDANPVFTRMVGYTKEILHAKDFLDKEHAACTMS